MKATPLLLLSALLVGSLAATVVMAATAEPKPQDYDSGTNCESRITKELLAATDVSQSLEEQEKHLNAAQAYRELAAQGFREC